jgi:hypothetical protein
MANLLVNHYGLDDYCEQGELDAQLIRSRAEIVDTMLNDIVQNGQDNQYRITLLDAAEGQEEIVSAVSKEHALYIKLIDWEFPDLLEDNDICNGMTLDEFILICDRYIRAKCIDIAQL